MCGLTGYSGKKPANLDKMKVVELFNQSRGKDSCGYYYDGLARYGVDKQKEFYDFIQDGLMINKAGSKGATVFIGHNRKSTKGASTLENAHPFIVDNLIQAHNGTIENSFELCDKYGIDHKDIHVDSLAIAHLIKKEGWKVLNEYKGYGAFLWHFTNEPDSLYVFHGASREKLSDEKLFVERPMFYMDGKDCVYFSSMPESLMAIRDLEQQEPISLTCNKVYKFTKGKLDAIVFESDRGRTNINALWLEDKEKAKAKVVPINYKKYNGPAYQPGLFEKELDKQVLKSAIWNELLPKEANDAKKVFFHKGRHWRTILKDGHASYVMLDGKYRIARGGDMLSPDEKHDRQADIYYFISGMMLQNEKTYKKARTLEDVEKAGLTKDERLTGNYAYFMSKFTRYPVTCLEDEGIVTTDDMRFRWYTAEKRFSGTTQPKFSNRKYEIKDGRLLKIHHQKDDPAFPQKVVEEDKTASKIHQAFVNNIMRQQDPNEAEAIVLAMKVAEIRAYFDVVFINLDEVQDLPPEVYEAIDIYLAELLGGMGLKDITQKDLDDYFQLFISESINQNDTFFEHMDDDGKAELDYYIEAAINNVDKERAKYSPPLKALPDSTSGVTTEQVQLFANLLAKAKILEDQPKNTVVEDADFEEVGDNVNFDCEAPCDGSFLTDKDVDRAIENEEALRQFDEIVNNLHRLQLAVDRCNTLVNSELGQELAVCVERGIDHTTMLIGNKVKDKTIKAKLEYIKVPF